MSDPILLIHGFPMDSSLWQPLAARLSASGRRVLTPDLPGFGQNAPWPLEAYSIEALAEELYRSLQGSRAIVGGVSMGGYILMALLRAHPEVVRAAIYLDTRPQTDSLEARAAREAMIRDLPAKGLESYVDAMVAKQLGPRATPELREQVRKLFCAQSLPGILGAQRAMLHRHDQTDLLSASRLPTLILVGAEDQITPPSVALEMHRCVPSSLLVQVAGAGHLACLEAPDAVFQAIDLFLHTLGE